MKNCPICGAVIPDNYAFCDKCVSPRAFQISRRYPSFPQDDIWKMAITQLEYENFEK